MEDFEEPLATPLSQYPPSPPSLLQTLASLSAETIELQTNNKDANDVRDEVELENNEVSRTIFISELLELPPFITTVDFAVKVTNRSQLCIIENIDKWLTPNEKDVFRRYP